MNNFEKALDKTYELYPELELLSSDERGPIIIRMQKMFGMGKAISRPERKMALSLWATTLLVEAAASRVEISESKNPRDAREYVYERLMMSHQGLHGRTMEQMIAESNRLTTAKRSDDPQLAAIETIDALIGQCAILMIMLTQEIAHASEGRPNPSTG